MSVDETGYLTVLDCLLLDGSKATVSLADMGIRKSRRNGESVSVYTSRIRLTPMTNDAGRCVTRFSRVPVECAEQSGDAPGFRLSCDKAVLERMGIDVQSFFAGL